MPVHTPSRWFTLVFCTLTSFSTAASAEYGHYQQPGDTQHYQNISFQQASLQGHMGWQERVFTPPAPPPVILPYVPFDDEQGVVVPQIAVPEIGSEIMVPQTLNHYQPPANHYRPQARTWRRQAQTHRAPQAPLHLSVARQKVLQLANRQLGIRYRWGGNTPRQGFDCSGFTKYAMKSSNITIPRTAAEQSRASRTISRSQLRPGDMIFFKTKGRHVNHVGIYLGNGRFIHAASGGGKVMTDDLRKRYWQRRLHKYGTFFS